MTSCPRAVTVLSPNSTAGVNFHLRFLFFFLRSLAQSTLFSTCVRTTVFPFQSLVATVSNLSCGFPNSLNPEQSRIFLVAFTRHPREDNRPSSATVLASAAVSFSLISPVTALYPPTVSPYRFLSTFASVIPCTSLFHEHACPYLVMRPIRCTRIF